jgi:peptide subunit release factor 1 (eRF1)
MALSSKEKQKIKKFVRKLEKVRGRHTELVSVYIPAGYDLVKIINHLAQEQGTASNIKDKTTQKHVVDSLEKMIRHLKLFKGTPPNGLAVFSGNISDKEGRVDIQVFSLEPPIPLNIRIYRCDQSFVLEHLKEIGDTEEMYGMIVMDRRDASIGVLKGTNIEELSSMHSAVPGKTKAGGQCLSDDTLVDLSDGQSIVLGEVEEGEEVVSYDFEKREFVNSKVVKVWSVAKDKMLLVRVDGEEIKCSEDHLFYWFDGTVKPASELKVGDSLLNNKGIEVKIDDITVIEKPVTLIDIEVENKSFVANSIVVHNSAQRFARIREEAAKEFFKRIDEAAKKAFLGVKELKGIILGGPGPAKEIMVDRGYLNEELKRKIISTQDLSYTGIDGLRELVVKSQDVLADEAISHEKKLMKDFLKILATQPEKVAYGTEEVKKALEMGAVDKLLLSETLEDGEMDFFEEKGEETGAEVKIISTDTSEGEQLRDLGKVAAMLRYALS